MEEKEYVPGLSYRADKSAHYDKPGVVIVGTGAVGTALAHAFYHIGYPVKAIVSRDKQRAQLLAGKVGSPFAFSLSDRLPTDAKLIFLCIPDDAISPTAKLLTESLDWEDKIVAHTSGALAASALQPLARKGAYLMSFHPVQTFSNTSEYPFAGIYIGIEGDPEAVAEGVKIAHAFQAKEVILTADKKPRYHLAASIASNFFVTLMAMACDVLESIGMERNEAIAMLRPLVTQTCTNVTSTLPELVLTGPAARGDQKTLKVHLDAIENHLPHYEPLYKALLAETLAVAHKGGRLNHEQIERIHAHLAKERVRSDKNQ
ncbi:MAG: Rossmann-like and DUF2520 domain-containing protein [Rhodothermales bacterium]